MTLMMQKKCRRMFPEGKSGQINEFLTATRTFSITKLCQFLSLLPPPKVNSTVLSFVRKENPVFPLSDVPKLESFFQKLFMQKRKQLAKVLKMNFKGELVEKTLEELNIDPQRRSETLSLNEVHSLFKTLA